MSVAFYEVVFYLCTFYEVAFYLFTFYEVAFYLFTFYEVAFYLITFYEVVFLEYDQIDITKSRRYSENTEKEYTIDHKCYYGLYDF